MIRRDLDKRLLGIHICGAPDTGPDSLNLDVVVQLVARFVDGWGKVRHSLHRLGIGDGEFFIALPHSVSPDAIVI
ncbi:MAG: hypothetical protein CMO26_18395 [Thiotrichales bacterium]|nr:hypothetical protein [Thiotrichales bacterium]|tara:strand:- start:64 stop:288 length:225 start_codon:yes stop_codon:yes gene_type:complete